MPTVADRLRGRVDRSETTLWLLVGDLLAIAVFVVVGEYSHGYEPIANAGRVVGTFLPFCLGWLVASIPAGMYRGGRESLRRLAGRTVGTWLVADAIAQALRLTPTFHGGASVRASLIFGTVAFLVGGLLLVLWRVGFRAFRSRRTRTAPA